MLLRRLTLAMLIIGLGAPAFAKPKIKTYNNAAVDVFEAALRTARERHVVTYVNEKMLMFTFSTGVSVWSKGFIANAAIEPVGTNRAKIIINVQGKSVWAMNAGDRMVNKFFDQLSDTLAGETSQRVARKPEAHTIDVAERPEKPPTPSLTASPEQGAHQSPSIPVAKGTVALSAAPELAEVSVDGEFIGNAPAELRLTPGKHLISVVAPGYLTWAREVTVHADSTVKLHALLQKEKLSPREIDVR
jgi:hypothetical protein